MHNVTQALIHKSVKWNPICSGWCRKKPFSKPFSYSSDILCKPLFHIWTLAFKVHIFYPWFKGRCSLFWMESSETWLKQLCKPPLNMPSFSCFKYLPLKVSTLNKALHAITRLILSISGLWWRYFFLTLPHTHHSYSNTSAGVWIHNLLSHCTIIRLLDESSSQQFSIMQTAWHDAHKNNVQYLSKHTKQNSTIICCH